MSPFAALAAKVVGAGAAAAMLSLGVAGGLAQAASPSPPPSPSSAAAPNGDTRADRRAVVAAVLESEAGVLGLKPEQLRADLKAGQKVSDLAKAKGMDKGQFTAKLLVALRPRLEALVDHKQITQAQADRVMDRIAKGRVPFWDGRHHKKA
jgi:hypothetical protein